jgi:hypothetical protein
VQSTRCSFDLVGLAKRSMNGVKRPTKVRSISTHLYYCRYFILELSSLEDQMSMRIGLAWGRRREAENGSAPPLATIDEDVDSSLRPKYPYFYIYDSQEESLAQAATRNRDKPMVAPSHPADAQKTAKA